METLLTSSNPEFEQAMAPSDEEAEDSSSGSVTPTTDASTTSEACAIISTTREAPAIASTTDSEAPAPAYTPEGLFVLTLNNPLTQESTASAKDSKEANESSGVNGESWYVVTTGREVGIFTDA